MVTPACRLPVFYLHDVIDICADSAIFRSHNTRGSILIYGRPQGICKRRQNSKPYTLRIEEFPLARWSTADEFIHKLERRRAHVSKFIHIYIHFRYAGVTTGTCVTSRVHTLKSTPMYYTVTTLPHHVVHSTA